MKTIKLVLVILFSIAIASCGGGGSGGSGTTTTTQTLSGTAAQGAAIASATVTIKDKNGSTTTGTTGTDGKYSIDVTGKTAPFLLKVPAGTGFLYSVATATGAANIHPFTDLIIRNWYKVQGSDVETDFSGTSALAKIPTATEINTIEAVIRNILSTSLTNVGATASNFNLLTTSFDANHTGFDKVLDNTKVAVSTTGAVTVTATDPTTGISGTMVSTNLTTDLSVADTTLPSDPTGLSAIPASASSMVLVWNASTDNVGVAGYNIYRGTTKVGASPYPVYSDTGLISSTNYCYQVEAVDGAGNVSVGKSASVCATTLAAADTTIPSAPSSLTATVVSASQIDLSWTASTSTDVAGYAIYRDTIKVAAVSGTSYSDTGLSTGTTYSYTVKAMDGALNLSAASNTASATPQAGVPVPTIPLAPTGITASAGNGRVTISWTASSGATSYNIFWSTTTGVTKASGTKITGATSPYTHMGRTNGTTYYYVVTAANASGESAESAQISGTPATTASLVGTWGETTLDHNNDGTWNTEVCKFTYNSDNTGASTCQANYGGTLQTGTPDTFTYTVVSNPDDSLTLDKIFSDGTPKTHRWVIGDDGNVMILDGTAQSNKQRFRVAVRLDTAKTYTNADLSGDYYLERYRYNGSYVALAALSTFDGVGGRNYSLTTNADGAISTDPGPIIGTYSVNADGLYTIDNANTGYLLGDGKFGINTHVNDPATWSFGLSMKKGDKTYSTADLAGTWAWAGFGDYQGTNFRAEIATLTCVSSGSCTYSLKVQRSDGSISYMTATDTISVAPDGSLSLSGSNGGPSWGAIGNNGNIMILAGNFDGTNPNDRSIAIAVKCSACSNLAGTGPSIGAAIPIANTSTHEVSSGAAFDGTNFLVGIGDKPLPDPNNTNQSVTAQLVSKTGALVGPRITTGATGGGDPWVAFGGGNYLLVWEQGTGISGQLVDTSGALVGVPFAIATATTGTKNNMGFRPVIFDGTNFLVAWFNFNSTTGNGDTADMFGQFITPNGALLGSVIPISTAVHGQRFPALAFDGANILAIWADGRNQSACDTSCYESDVYGQFITKSGASAAGALSGSNFLISAGTLPRDNPVSIAFDGTNYLVTFVEETTLPNACPAAGCNWEAYGILVTKGGAPTGSRFVIGNTTARAKMFPSPNYLGTQYLVTWSDGMGTTSASVKGQYITTSGAVSGTEFTLFSPAASGALPYFGVVVTGGGVNLAITGCGIPDATDPSNTDLTTSADVMGSIITFP